MMASKGGQQLETLEAFSGRRRKSKARSQRTPALKWMHSQCSAAVSATEGQLFPTYSGDISSVPPLEFQSYHYWKSVFEAERFAHPRRYRRRTILIQPLTHSQASSGYKHTEIHPSVLSHLCRFCEKFFHGMTIEVAQPVDLSQIRKLTRRVHQTTNREQFLVGDIRKFLQSRRPRRAFCIIGVTVADLYPGPEWNFVLGEASMAQGCGVFSFGRYFNSSVAVEGATTGVAGSDGDNMVERNGDEVESEQLRNLWVLVRVMSHELCHIFGLKHCYYFNCAMNESSTITEAIIQPLFLCPICLRKMQKVVRFDPLERYRHLLQVIKQLHRTVLEAYSHTGGRCPANERGKSECCAKVDRIDGVRTEDSDCRNQGEHDPDLQTAKEVVTDGVDCDGQHSERFEDAIGWLEKVVSSLGQSEDQWAGQGVERPTV